MTNEIRDTPLKALAFTDEAVAWQCWDGDMRFGHPAWQGISRAEYEEQRNAPHWKYRALYLAPQPSSAYRNLLERMAKALPVLKTMLTLAALHRGAEIAEELLQDVSAALARVGGGK